MSKEVILKPDFISMIRNSLGAMAAFSLAMLLFMLQATVPDVGELWLYALYAFVVSIPVAVTGYVLSSALLHRKVITRFTDRLLDGLGMTGMGLPIAGFGMVLETFSWGLSTAYYATVAIGFFLWVRSIKLETRSEPEPE